MIDLENYETDYDCPTCKKGKLVLKQVSNQTKALYSCNYFKSDGNGGIDKCEQTIWLKQFNKHISPSQMDKLIKDGETDYIKFKSHKGNEFEAKIMLYESHTKMACKEEEEEEMEEIQCPACDSKIYQKGSYYCEGYKDETCAVFIPRTIAGYTIKEDLARELLKGNLSEVIHGFKSKNGNTFSARLVLNEDTLKVSFDNTIRECPMEDCGGSIINFPKVYKCSENRDEEGGCDFLMFKNISGGEISPKILNELIDNKKTTEPVEMISKKGKPFSAYLIYSSDGKINFEFANS